MTEQIIQLKRSLDKIKDLIELSKIDSRIDVDDLHIEKKYCENELKNKKNKLKFG